MDMDKISKLAQAIEVIRIKVSEIGTHFLAAEDSGQKTPRGKKDWSKRLAKPVKVQKLAGFVLRRGQQDRFDRLSIHAGVLKLVASDTKYRMSLDAFKRRPEKSQSKTSGPKVFRFRREDFLRPYACQCAKAG